MEYDRDSVKAWAGDSAWRALRADYARFRANNLTGWGSEGFWALALYRLQHFVVTREPRSLWMPARVALNVVKKVFTLVTTVDLHPTATIGPGMLIRHAGQILRAHGLFEEGERRALYRLYVGDRLLDAEPLVCVC